MNIALLILNGSLIAGIYAFAKAGSASAMGVLAWQLLFAAVVISVVAYWRGQAPRLDPSTLRYAAIAGVLGVSAPNLVTFCALSQVPAGLVGVIGALSPLFTYLLALGIGIERLGAVRAAGISLGFLAYWCCCCRAARCPIQAPCPGPCWPWRVRFCLPRATCSVRSPGPRDCRRLGRRA